MAKWNPRTAKRNGTHDKIRDVENDVKELQTQNSTRQTTISKGALTVNKGASINVNDGGDIVVADDGQVIVQGTGSFESRNTSGRRSAWIGNTVLNAGTGQPLYGATVAVYTPSGDPFFYIWDVDGSSDLRTAMIGTPANRVGNTLIHSENTNIYGNTEIGLYSAAQENSRIFMNPPEGSGSFSLTIGTNGRLYRTASTRAVKTDIEDLNINPQDVLQMQPRTWRSKQEVEENPECPTWHVGFIAEELDEIGLTGFVEYDHNERPVSIAYDRLSAALLSVVKEQDRRLNEIEARLNALDGREATPLPEQEWTSKPRRRGEAPTSDNVAPIHPEAVTE